MIERSAEVRLLDRRDDRQEIVDTLIRYATALDQRDWDLLNEVFTEDAIAHYRAGNFGGREAIIAMIRQHLGGCGTSQHLLGNHIVQVDGDSATSSCYARVLHLGAGERAHLTPFEVCGRYMDKMALVPAGWRIVHRRVEWVIRRGDEEVLQPG